MLIIIIEMMKYKLFRFLLEILTESNYAKEKKHLNNLSDHLLGLPEESLFY